MSKLRVEQKVDEDLEHQQLQQHLTKQQQQHVQQQQHSAVLAGHPKSYVDILQQSLAREQQRLAAEEQKAKQDKQQQKQRKQSIPSENKASNNNNQLQKQHAATVPQPQPQQQLKAPIPQQQQQAKEVQQQQQQQQQQQHVQHAQQPPLKAPIPQQQAKEIHKTTTDQAISNIPQFSLANPSQVEGDFKQEKQEVFQYILHQHNALHHIKLYILQLQATNDHFTRKCAHALENKAQNHHGLPHFEKDTHHLLNESTLDEAMKPLSVLLNQNAQHFQRVISLTNDPNVELRNECQNFFNSFLTNQYQLYELLHDVKKLEERCQAWGQKVLGMNIMKLTLTEMMSRAANPATHADQVWQPSANCSSSTSLKDHINAVPFLPRHHFMQQEEQQQPQSSAKRGVDTDQNNVSQQHSQQASHVVHPITAPPQPQRMEAKLPQPIKLPLESQQQPQQPQQPQQKQPQQKQPQQKQPQQETQKKDVPQQKQHDSLKSNTHMDTTNRRRSLADLVAENNQKKLTNHTPSNSAAAHSRDGQHTGIGGSGLGNGSAQKLANGIGAAGGTTYRRGSTASINNNNNHNDHNGQHHVSFAHAIPSSVQQDSLVLKFRPGSASSSTSATSTTSAAQSVGPDGLTRSQRRKQFWLSYLDKHPEKKDAMYHKNNDIAMSKTEKGQQIDDKHKKEVEEKLAREKAKKEALESRSVINGAYIQALPNAAVVTVNTDSVNGGNDYIDADYLVL